MKHENDIQSRYISNSVQCDRVQGNLNTASDVTEFGKLLKFDEKRGCHVRWNLSCQVQQWLKVLLQVLGFSAHPGPHTRKHTPKEFFVFPQQLDPGGRDGAPEEKNTLWVNAIAYLHMYIFTK